MTLRKTYVDGTWGQVHVLLTEAADPSDVPLVCLHLSPGSGRMYTELLAHLDGERTVVAPDTPGFGASDAPPEPADVPALTRNLVTVLDALGLERVDLLGYHTGSKIAVETAIAFPERVRAVTLVSAPVYTEAELAAQRAWLAAPRLPQVDGAHLVEQFTELVRWLPEGTPLALVQREFGEQQRGGENAFWGYVAAFGYRHDEALPRVTQPVLLLCPEDDLEIPTLRAEQYLANGRMLRLPGWGHQMMATRTAEVADLLREHRGA